MLKKLKEKWKSMSARQLVALLVPLAVVLVLSLTLYLVFGRRLLIIVEQPEIFKRWLDGYGFWGEGVFFLIRTAQTIYKFIPSEPLEVASGYAFGVWGGFWLCLLGTELGSLIIILLTKKFGVRFVSKFADPEELKYSFAFLKDSARFRLILFLIYFIPGAPKDVLTYFIGFMDIGLPEFLLLNSVARVPSIITSTICGACFGQKNYAAAVVVYLVTVLISLLGLWAYRKLQRKKTPPAAGSASGQPPL